MIGIHINDNEIPYTQLILDGVKRFETRFRPTLRPFVGQRVAIIRTGKGKAEIVGTVRIVGEVWWDAEAFDFLRPLHCVPKGSKQDTGKGKWCYLLREPQKLDEPIVIGHKFFTGNRTYRTLGGQYEEEIQENEPVQPVQAAEDAENHGFHMVPGIPDDGCADTGCPFDPE